MAAGVSRFLALFGSLLAVGVLTACAEHAVAPHDDPTPPNDTENVTIFPDGEEAALNGRLFGASADPLVILTHMRPNDQTAWYPFAQELASQGFATFTFDFRGYGLSTGDQDYDKLDEDLTAVIEYWHDRGRENVLLLGASMGATTSLVVAGATNVRAIVAISPPSRFESQDALAAVGTLTVSKLFVVSELDAPTLQFDQLYEAAAGPKEEEVYPGNLHGTDLLDPLKNEDAATVRQRIIDFLDGER
jgi:pimeloyl-ACP methyl ester carboxylesterase